MKSKLPRIREDPVPWTGRNKDTIADLNYLQVEELLRASRILERERGQLPAQAE
jgi:hypothetical protein